MPGFPPDVLLGVEMPRFSPDVLLGVQAPGFSPPVILGLEMPGLLPGFREMDNVPVAHDGVYRSCV